MKGIFKFEYIVEEPDGFSFTRDISILAETPEDALIEAEKQLDEQYFESMSGWQQLKLVKEYEQPTKQKTKE